MKKLLNDILPVARSRGVSEELRGWNWSKPPLRPPISGEYLPVHIVASKYCPTDRDLFLSRVVKIPRQQNVPMSQGLAVHQVVEKAFRSFTQGDNYTEFVSKLSPQHKKLWDLCIQQCNAEAIRLKSSQPLMPVHDITLTAVPFLVELRLNGSLLGFSEDVVVDAFDYLRHIVYNLKMVVLGKEKWHRLYPTAYALIIESIYEIPVDVGATVYVEFLRGSEIRVSKDVFFIDDSLRAELIEMRDRKIGLLITKTDPGKPEKPDYCILVKCPYLEKCWNIEEGER
ncbi:MAG: type I-A CRISPR-associated protein Cas4/Csa1 [Candidatus Korarchaeota archaeon]